jgi:hypothetical protein
VPAAVGGPGVLDRLVELSGSEFTSLMLEVARRRAARETPATVVRGRLASVLSYRCATVTDMPVRKKRSISMPPDLDAEIASAAADAGISYSAWLAETARKEFIVRAGLAAVSQFEQDHGAFTAEEIAESDAWAAQVVAQHGHAQTGQSRTGTARRSA